MLTVLSDSFYPAGSTRSVHWMRSPLFIHSFPRGQVLSLWWMGAGTGQLFSLDETSLTSSELKRPPCQRSSAIPLFCIPLPSFSHAHRHEPITEHPRWLFSSESTWGKGSCSLEFHLHGSDCLMPGGYYGVDSGFSGEWWGRNLGGCVDTVWWGLATVAAALSSDSPES